MSLRTSQRPKDKSFAVVDLSAFERQPRGTRFSHGRKRHGGCSRKASAANKNDLGMSR